MRHLRVDGRADGVQNATDELLEQVFVYDFQEQENLGW